MQYLDQILNLDVRENVVFFKIVSGPICHNLDTKILSSRVDCSLVPWYNFLNKVRKFKEI